MAEMKFSNIDFIRLLPAFMRDDGASKGLAEALNRLVPALADDVHKLSTWDQIDKLSAPELDALAWELNILWYDNIVSVEAKRDIIKNSDLVYQRLGTKWAVESVIRSYFGDGHVSEWWEYEDGEPGHFRVYSSNPSLSQERLTEFIKLMNEVKRASAVLDGIYITLTSASNLSAGTAIHEGSWERHGIGYAPITV